MHCSLKAVKQGNGYEIALHLYWTVISRLEWCVVHSSPQSVVGVGSRLMCCAPLTRTLPCFVVGSGDVMRLTVLWLCFTWVFVFCLCVKFCYLALMSFLVIVKGTCFSQKNCHNKVWEVCYLSQSEEWTWLLTWNLKRNMLLNWIRPVLVHFLLGLEYLSIFIMI